MRIPAGLTPSQAAAYRTVLTRSYELLSDPKPSRHSGYRAAQVGSCDVILGGAPARGSTCFDALLLTALRAAG